MNTNPLTLILLVVVTLLSVLLVTAQDDFEDFGTASSGGAASLRIDPIPANTALAVRVNAGKDECFFEEVRIGGQKLFFHFEVTGGGQLDIDAMVTGPEGELIWSAEKEHEDRILFKAGNAGQYKFCLSNKMSTVTQKTVAFSIQVSESAGRGGGRGGGVPAGGGSGINGGGGVDPVERMSQQLADGLQELRNEQQYLKTRERIHRDTVESTNSRILVYSVAELSLIIGVGVVQLWYLKSCFDKRREV